MNFRRWWAFGFDLWGRLLEWWQKRELEAVIAQADDWDRTHMPMLRDSLGRCAICARPRVTDADHCPGPYRPWKATKRETEMCAEGFHHEELLGGFVRGCEICDPARLRHGGYTP